MAFVTGAADSCRRPDGRITARGDRCKVPFENDPELIVSTEHALKPALIEWSRGKLNAFADADDILSISRAINIGTAKSRRIPNGFADRQAWLKRSAPLRGCCFPPPIRGEPPHADRARPGRHRAIRPVPRAESQPVRGSRYSIFSAVWRPCNYIWAISTDLRTGDQDRDPGVFLNQSVKNFDRWPDERMIIAARQLFCRMDGIEVGDIDGLFGLQSEQAFLVYESRKASGGTPDPKAGAMARRGNATTCTGSAITAGNPAPPRLGRANPTWRRFLGRREQIKFVGAAIRMRIAWDPAKTVTKSRATAKSQAP